MSYLLFWQDTIDHCKSAEVNDTLLDHFQVLFLEQLLYGTQPSIHGYHKTDYHTDTRLYWSHLMLQVARQLLCLPIFAGS